MKIKNICVITATYPLNGYGGIFVKSQCKMLKYMGYNVSVLYARPFVSARFLFRTCKKQIDKIVNDDIEVYVNDFYCYALTYTVPFLKRSINASCNELIKKYEEDHGLPDLIIGNFCYPAGVGAEFVSKLYNLPLIMVEHLSLFLNNKKHFWLNKTLRSVVSQTKETICVSEGLAVGLRKRLKMNNQFTVIPNPIDDQFHFYNRTLNKKSPFIFLSVGSLRKVKNHDLLIQSFANAFKENDNVKLLIVGEGEERDNLQLLIDTLGVSDRVLLIGAVSQEKLMEYYKKSACFVLLSKNETFGIAYREAMATGLPVISSNNNGIRINWENEFGIIVDTSNFLSIVDALRKVPQDTSFNSMYIATRMKELYSYEAVGKQFKRLIDCV